MKPQTLTQTLLAALMLTSASQASPALRSKIAAKEKQISTLQTELTSLKAQLTAGTATSYSVKAGDTLSSIARRHGISPNELAKKNSISDPSKLMVGQKLIVGGKKARIQTTNKAQASYTVVKGDTFYSIARRNKMSVTELKALNPDVNASRIARGQKLVVTGTAAIAKAKLPKKSIDNTQLISTKRSTPKPAPKVEKNNSPTPKAKPAPKTQKQKTESKPKLAPIPTPVVKKETPKPKPVIEAPAPPVVEEQVPSPSGVSSIILTSEMTFEAFATKHGTSTTKLNELNGWNLPKSTTLARGSEIYIPK